MISQIASAISDWLVTQGAVTAKDKNLFAYAAYSLLFGIMPIIIIVVLGLIFDMLIEGILLITPFMLIRKFSGGYHLESPLACVVTSTSLLTLALLSVQLVRSNLALVILGILVILATMSLVLFSPIDSESRKLTAKETIVFRLIARVLAVLFAIVYLLLALYSHVNIAAPIGVGIIIPAALQFPCMNPKKCKRHISETSART